jgi:hypothetical protein
LKGVAAYRYVLRSERDGEVLQAEHDDHRVGDLVQLKGSVWVVEAIVTSEDVERVLLRPAADGAASDAA